MKGLCVILLATLLMVVVACDKFEKSFVTDHHREMTVFHLRTRSDVPLDNTHFVSEKDLSAYLKYKSLMSDKEIDVRAIDPITSESGDTLLYIIHYDEGWDLLAADKRATLPLSSSPTGALELDPRNPMTTWIHCLAEDVLSTRQADEKEFTNPDITEFNVNQWKAINADISLFQDTLDLYFSVEQTRDTFPPFIPLIPYPGHYELVNVITMPVSVDSVTHLIPLSWSQTGGYFNAYVPYKDDGSGDHAPAGCVAVAGAQMLYYLHNYMSVPYTAPTTAYSYGDINNPYYDQGDYQISAWAYMDSLGTHPYVGMLIAAVAKKSYMTFGNTVSTTSLVNLAYSCLPNFLIASTGPSSYSDSTVQLSLNNDIPVIVQATPTEFPFYGSHAFIIDGYRRSSIETSYVYLWVWDDYDPSIPYPKIPAEFIVTYSSPYISDYYMNWGYGPEYNSVPFAVSGDWMMTPTNNFIYNRSILWNFHNYNE